MNVLVRVLVIGLSLSLMNLSLQAQNRNDGPDVVTVRVKGMGVDHDAALKDALRKAVETGGHLEVFAQSESENYVLTRDTVLAQVTGLIKDYRILSEGEYPLGGYFVEITAKIDRKIIDATWGQVQILLKQMGKPKILVNIVEKINDMALKNPDDKPEHTSLLENKIEQLLVEKGFDVVDKNQIERLKQDKLDQAGLTEDVQAMKTLAGELGAQMFIVGFARASGPQLSNAYGVQLFMWETDVTLKAFWSETGQILFNRSETGTRGGSRAPGPPGAKDAIAKAGDKMAQACLQAILEKWSRQSVGGGKVALEVKGLDFKRKLMLHDGLKQIQGVQDVTREWHKPIAKFEIGTIHSAAQFAEILADSQFENFALDIDDQKYNTIQATVVEVEKTAGDQKTITEEPTPTPSPEPSIKNEKIEKPAAQKATTQPTSKPAVQTTQPTTKPVVPSTQPTQPATKPASQPTTKPALEM